MLPEMLGSLFHLADNFALEFMAILALIWFGALGYVIVRKISALVRRGHAAKLQPSACGNLAEAALER